MSKNKIIAAAIKLFSELGYHRTSMDDIAKEANVAKGTLYYNYKSKADLFETIVGHGYELLTSGSQDVLREDQPTNRQIAQIVSKHIELFLQYRPLIHIISNETTNGIEPEILQRIREKKQAYIRFLSGVLEQGIQDGSLKAVNRELAASSMLGLLESACAYYIEQEGKLSREELEATINAFILPALLKH
ncbi:TetR/AcrR family transcriptional regulator [Paenibacillus sp. strain BS8-2]